jgi:hypothetical protein
MLFMECHPRYPFRTSRIIGARNRVYTARDTVADPPLRVNGKEIVGLP